MSKTALIFGAGKIGRGFIGQLMHLNNWQLIYVDYSEEIVNSLKKDESYTVHIMGNKSKSTIINNYEVLSLNEKQRVFDAWDKSSLVFTSVGGENLSSIAPLIAESFKNKSSDSIKNIITCENWKSPADNLKEEVMKNLSGEEQRRFNKEIGITEAVVMRVSVNPPTNNNNTFKNSDAWGNDYWELPVDKKLYKGKLPELKYFNFIEDFESLLDRKIYTNNTSNATIAYIGYLKGYKYTADAANDSYISKILDSTYSEINTMIVKEYNIDLKEQENFSKQARNKYTDKNIVDPLYRHAADPIRKLGPNDRLIAPARLCLKHNIQPVGIVKTIVAALYFNYQNDSEALKLEKIRKEKGIIYILKNICCLEENEELYGLIINEINS